MKPKNKSNLRVVPVLHETLGTCWAIKDGQHVLGTFVNKNSAESRKNEIEQSNIDNFMLSKSINSQFELHNLL